MDSASIVHPILGLRNRMSPNSLGTDGRDPWFYLPDSSNITSSTRRNLFSKKLNLCCYTFDFTDPSKNAMEKEIKRQTLLELLEYMTLQTRDFTEGELEDITKMLVTNLFRTLPPPSHENAAPESLDTEEEEPAMDLEWPHLQIVYEFLWQYIYTLENDGELEQRYFNHSFVNGLLNLFDSEDPRERGYVMKIVHRIYGKFRVHRPFIRKTINDIFYVFVYETEKHNGIGELLEILVSIIHGFDLPLKEEHKLFLKRALIPLHKPKCLPLYDDRLSSCISQFLERDCKLADTIIRGLLKYWPVTDSQKEVWFLMELGGILEATETAEFQSCMVPLFRQIARSLNSVHFQVAEQALLLWRSEYIVSLIKENRQVVLPLVFTALQRNTTHWNQTVQKRTLNVRRLFMRMDKALFEECQHIAREDDRKARDLERKRIIIWRRLEEAGSSKPTSSENLLGTEPEVSI